jgi:hypothetical protein
MYVDNEIEYYLSVNSIFSAALLVLVGVPLMAQDANMYQFSLFITTQYEKNYKRRRSKK